MDKKTFNSLIRGVTIALDHPNFFIYDGEVVRLSCSRFPANEGSYYLVSVESDESGCPWYSTKLLDVDASELVILIEQSLDDLL